MDKKLEQEKTKIDALIDQFSELMDRVYELQREISDRLFAFSLEAPLEGQEGSAATEELQAKMKRAVQKILRLAKGGDRQGPV